MVKIGVVSDTHIPYAALSIPEVVLRTFADEAVDLILHAGDMVEEEALYDLMAVAEVKAVCGNMDSVSVKSAYPDRLIVSVEEVKILLVHGWGEPYRLPERLCEAYSHLNPDSIVFGHSHIPFCADLEGIFLFNPGTPTDRRFAERRSFGILKVDGKEITGRIIYID